MSDYQRSDLKAAIDSLPLEWGEVVFCHANIGYFGRADGIAGADDLCQMFFDAIIERIGPDGTLCVPTFTYSFSRGDGFDLENTPSAMGIFAEWVRKRTPWRSCDPSYSVAATGVRAREMTQVIGENSFDQRASFFARFMRTNGKVLNLNFDAGSTFVHWVERELRVPYRFDKTFDGVIFKGSTERRARSTIFVHYRHPTLVARFEAFDALARERGMFQTAKLGRGEMGVISAADTYKLIKETLPSRPWFLTSVPDGFTPDMQVISALR